MDDSTEKIVGTFVIKFIPINHTIITNTRLDDQNIKSLVGISSDRS